MSSLIIKQIRNDMKKMADKKKAEDLQRFFKTAPGEYGEGDKFHGVVVPDIRKLVKKFKDISLSQTQSILKSPWHEERFFALQVLVHKFQTAKEDHHKEKIYKTYISNFRYINNWDLVDTSAKQIVGAYLFDKGKTILYQWAKSKDLWTRRISIISTFYFIGKKEFNEALKIAKILLNDEHDLIHKAVGWMLREIGNRNLDLEEKFLKEHYKKMPRTMLRYSIEKFPKPKRQEYLRGSI